VPPPWAWHGVGTGAAAIAAGIVLHELAAHLGGATTDGADDAAAAGPGIRYEHTITLATGLVERHPVLPLPVDLPGRPGLPVRTAPTTSGER
jgi:hypothetical protein